MNMISTGTFLPEMDASNKQETLAEKFAAVWEKKNSKAARAGGVSLMALSLAACGSSSDDTAAVEEPVVEEPVVEEPVVEEPTTPVVNELALTTSSSDDIEGTAGADSITGAVSALSAVRTLQATDAIDGGEGSDSIDLTLDAAFTGFTTGSMAGVETVNITNSGSVARNYDGTGTTGVEAFTLTGAVNLSDIAAVASVTAGARTADLSIAYAAAAVTGTADVQTLSITDFGVADDADTTVDETDAVAITLASVETTDFTVAGTNVVDASAIGSKAITATGDGTLEITAVNAALKTYDGSGAGAQDLTVAGASAMTSITTGAGDDALTIVLDDDVTANATIAMGEGDDSVTITAGGASTTQLAMTGAETLKFGAVTGATAMSMSKASGVTGLVATKTMDHDVTLSSVGAQAMDIQLQGVNANNKAIASDHSGATTVSIDTPAATATATSRSANTIDVTVSKSTSVDLDVAAKMDWDGVLTAAKAESVVVSIDGGTTSGAQIVAASATSVTVDSVAAASTLLLNAAKATEVNITNAKNLDVGNATLAAVEYLTTSGAGDLDFTGEALEGISTISATNTGEMDFGALGSATLDNAITAVFDGSETLDVTTVTTNGQNITIDAINQQGAVTFGDITTGGTAGTIDVTLDGASTFDLDKVIGHDIVIDAGGAIGAVTYADQITVSGDLTITGSALNANDITGGGAVTTVLDGTTNTITVNGGLAVDTITVTGDTTTTSLTMKGDYSLGTDVVTIDLNTNALTGAATIDITGMSNYDAVTIQASDQKANTIKLGSGTDADTIVWNGAQKATITGFDTTEDTLNFDSISVAVGGTVNAVTSGATAAVTDGDLYVIADGATSAKATTGTEVIADYTDLTDVAAYLDEAFTLNDDADEAIFVINDLVADISYAYHYVEADAAGANLNTIASTDLALIGVITEESGSALVAGDVA